MAQLFVFTCNVMSVYSANFVNNTFISTIIDHHDSRNLGGSVSDRYFKGTKLQATYLENIPKLTFTFLSTNVTNMLNNRICLSTWLVPGQLSRYRH